MRTGTIDRRRQAGHFPYYKLQVWNARLRAWEDIQRRFATAKKATAHAGHELPARTMWRIMEVHRDHRHPLA